MLPEADDQRVELADVELVGVFRSQGLDLTVRALGSRLRTEGTARLAPVALTGQFSGAVTFAADDLTWLRTFDQRISAIGGALTGRVTVAGTPRQPVVEGEVELRDGRVVVEDPELRLEQIGVVARIDPSGGFEVSGSARQAPGARDKDKDKDKKKKRRKRQGQGQA